MKKKPEQRDGLQLIRSVPTSFETREAENGEKHISGYFAVFDSDYECGPFETESVARGAFRESLDGGDIRALTNHDTTLVLGRTTAGTLALREDEHGLWGDVIINPLDSDALNTWARVQRGDVTQCSFGFFIRQEAREIREDGSVHYTLQDVDLHEVSVCTFPAYEATSISARSAQRAEERKRETETWKNSMKARLNHVKSSASS